MGQAFFREKAGGDGPDFGMDDTALAQKADGGLVVITGCSHAGICNILECAKSLLHETWVLDILGGFQLMNPGEDQMAQTQDYLRAQDLARMHPCACAGFRSMVRQSGNVPVEEAGVGLALEFD